MNIQECYETLHGNYSEALSRLMKDSLVERFMLKFLADGTMAQLKEAIDAQDIEASFVAAHTLKGVAANLAFSELATRASELTEQLRSRSQAADPALYAAVEESYNLVIATLEEYKQQA